jgi:hypothetical protein
MSFVLEAAQKKTFYITIIGQNAAWYELYLDTY